MNTPRHRRRGTLALLVAAATSSLVAATTFAAVGSPAHAATHRAAHLSTTCSSTTGVPARVGHIGGIAGARSANADCSAHNASDPANGTPPLIYHGGPMMSTASTGPLVVRPIYWNPSGHPMAKSYKALLSRYVKDVAAASGQHSNVYSTLTEYFGSNGNIRYQVKAAAAINDTHALPTDGCTVAGTDGSGIYADGSGYDACLDDDQIIAETDRVVTAKNLPRDYGHIYVLFLPKHVESCFYPGSTTTANNFCTINYQPSAAYCAYHSQAGSGSVYANMPFPVYGSGTGYTCSSEARFPSTESPNGNPDGDTEISPTSHEIMEAVTDPDTSTGWYDASGYENGDECAYVYGATQGTEGSLYNQVINRHHYLTQEEFSNADFASTGNGCLQSE